MGKNRRILIGIIIVTTVFFACGCSFKADEVNPDSAIISETSADESLEAESKPKLDTSLPFEELFNEYASSLGETYDYGITYAYISNMKDGIGETDKAAIAEFLSKEENSYILDFTLPLTEDIFVPKETAQLTVDAAKAFSTYVFDTYGEDKLKELTLSSVSDEGKTKLKNEWLKTLGVSIEYTPAAGFFFLKNEGADAAEYPFYIPSENYDLYISLKDLENNDYRELFRPYQISGKYWEEDLKDAIVKYFGYEKNVTKVRMYTCFSDEAPNGGTLDADYWDRKIRFFHNFDVATDLLLHEYTHHLQLTSNAKAMLMRREAISAMDEGYAVEFDCYEYRKLARNSLIMPVDLNYKNLWNEEEKRFDSAMYNDMLAYAEDTVAGIEYYSVSQTMEITDTEIKPYTKLSYHVLGSLIHYLKLTKGEETVMEAFAEPEKFEALFDGDYEATYKAWREWLYERVHSDEETLNKILFQANGNNA